jgi:hypothetical protein
VPAAFTDCTAHSARSASLFGLAPDGVCRAKPVTRPAGELLPRRFTLTAAPMQKHRGRGGLFSVALSLSGSYFANRTVGVTHHRALWSPDFPPWLVPRPEKLGRFPDPAAQAQAPRRPSQPATNLFSMIRSGPLADNPASFHLGILTAVAAVLFRLCERSARVKAKEMFSGDCTSRPDVTEAVSAPLPRNLHIELAPGSPQPILERRHAAESHDLEE